MKTLYETITGDIRHLISFLVTLLSFTGWFILMFHKVPEGNAHLVDVTGGFLLGTGVCSCFGWLFTNSKQEKTNG